MNFVLDNQLPVHLAASLRKWGHDCIHVIDVKLDDAEDDVVWAWSIANERIVVSKDEDFVYLALRPGDTGRLVWVRLGNCRNASLVAAFEQFEADLVLYLAFEGGRRILEIR